MARFYIRDKTSNELYKRNLSRKEMRYFRRFAKYQGYDIVISKHKTKVYDEGGSTKNEKRRKD